MTEKKILSVDDAPDHKEFSEIAAELGKVPVCCVSTYSGTHIKNRMMHFAVSSDFRFFLASMRTDPKTKQIVLHSEISLLIYSKGDTFPEDKEIEVTGHARIIDDEEKKEQAISLLLKRSPVVGQMVQSGNTDLLAFIEVVPEHVKFRAVKDVLQGVPPKIIDFEHRADPVSDWERFKRKLNAWVAETRYPFLSVTLLPMLLGTTIAWARNRSFDPVYFTLAFLGVIFLHLGTNMINDYFDYKSGNDDMNTEFVRPFSGGSRMIQLGLLTPLEVCTGAIVFFALGIAIGVYFMYQFGIPIFILGLIGVLSGFFYTAPLFNWVSKGFGELLVGLNFGVLVSLGSYYVQTRMFTVEVVWASVPLGILVTAILWINEIPDFNADKKSGKKTLVVRLGRKKSMQVFTYILLSGYVILVAGILLRYLPKIMLTGLLSLPFAVYATIYANKFYSRPFDMAPGNGFTVLSFNVLGITFILSYLLLRLNIVYFLPLLLLSLVYLWWNYRTIKVQRDAFSALKEIL